MGNTCTHVNNGSGGHHSIKPKILVPQNQPIRVQSEVRITERRDVQSGNRSGTPVRIAVSDVKFDPVRPGSLTPPNQPQKISPVTIIVTANIPKANNEEKEAAPPIVAATTNIQKVGTEEHEVALATTANINRENIEGQQVAVAPATNTAAANINRGNIEKEENATANTTATVNIQRADTELEAVGPVTNLVTENQVDKDTILGSNENKSTSSNCKESMRSNLAILPKEEDRDECPICLDGYDEENPNIMIKCKHRYHLACIYEWMERSATCPMCSKVMEFEEDC